MGFLILNIKTRQKKRLISTKDNSKKKIDNSNLIYIAANAAEEKKGENIVLLDVSRLTVLSDYFLIITAKSSSQIEAIASNIEEELVKMNCQLISKEGFIESNWTVLDFGNIIVHIMREKEREYYKLERFWCNATTIDKKQWKKAS